MTDFKLPPTDEKGDTHTLRSGNPGTAVGYKVGTSWTKKGEIDPDLIHYRMTIGVLTEGEEKAVGPVVLTRHVVNGKVHGHTDTFGHHKLGEMGYGVTVS